MKKTFLTILLFISCFANAGTFYISPLGNDATGNGTAAAPWKTLKKATTAVTTPGDIIHVNAGTYSESQNCSLAKGVSIVGDGADVTIIKSNLAGQWSVFISLSSGQDTDGSQEISGVTLDGQYVSESNNKTWWAIEVRGRSNISIHDCKIINFRDRGVVFDGNDVTDPVTDPGHYATGNKFYNNTVLNSAAGTGNYGGGLLNIGGQDGMEIYNNTMIQTQRVAFKNGWPLKYWDNGWLKGVKVHDNTLTKAPYVGSYPGENGDWDFAIELFNIFGLQIYNNTIQGSIDLNYNKMGSYPYCVWIHHNTLNHATLNSNFESGIILEFRTESALIENNTLNNVSSGVQFNTRTKSSNGGYPNPGGGTPAGGFSQLLNNVIRNNLFTNVYQGNGTGTAAGVTVISESGNDPQISGLEISHNTIIAKAGDAPWIGIDFTSMENGNGTGIVIRDNIVQGFNDAWLKGSTPRPGIVTLSTKNNIAFGNGNSNAASWPGGAPAGNVYTGNLTVNPNLNASYKPNAGSPAINAGTDGTDIGFTGGQGGPPPPPGNIPPVANAGADQTITLPLNAVALSGSGSDQDGTIASFKWTDSNGGVIANTPGTIISNLVAGTFTYTLTVTDDKGATGSDQVVVTVKPAAPPPPARTLWFTIHVYTDGTISKSAKLNATKTLKSNIRYYTDGTFD
jgi:hypothetical protein